MNGPASVELSQHAVERFRERVKPALSLEAAEDELVRLLEKFGRFADPPGWLSVEEAATADCWLMLGSDIAFPVRGGLVMSCLVRATYRPVDRRQATNENKFEKRKRRADERPWKRRWEGKQAKKSRHRDRRWEADAA